MREWLARKIVRDFNRTVEERGRARGELLLLSAVKQEQYVAMLCNGEWNRWDAEKRLIKRALHLEDPKKKTSFRKQLEGSDRRNLEKSTKQLLTERKARNTIRTQSVLGGSSTLGESSRPSSAEFDFGGGI